MSDISTNMPPQHSNFGMVVGNTSMETPSTLTQASTTHGKYRREIKVNFFCKKHGSATELCIISHLIDCNDFFIDRIPSTTPGAEPPRDVRDSGSARSHSTHLETSSSDRP